MDIGVYPHSSIDGDTSDVDAIIRGLSYNYPHLLITSYVTNL